MAEKKKVLIISSRYLRGNAISSIRQRKIAKYLHATGRYDVSVLTVADKSEIAGRSKKKPVFLPDLSIMEKDGFVSGFTLVISSNSLAVYGVLRKPFRFVWRGLRKALGLGKPKGKNIRDALYHFDDTSFYRRAKKVIDKKKLYETDVIMSTYGPFAPHYIARFIKKKNPAAFWIASFDDPVYKENHTPRLFRRYAKGYTKKTCNTADVITAVSQGFLDMTELPEGVLSCVSENGFDPDDIAGIKPKENNKFTLTYAGTLYTKNRQDLSVLFQAIRELIDEGAVDEGNIRIEYAGRDFNLFERQVKDFGLQNALRSYGFVHRGKALEIQKNSDMLILASWNEEGYTGVLTGKIYEYMMMNKPIVSIITGNLPDSAVKEVIDRCLLGFCYEQARHERDYILLKDYIRVQYRHFIGHGSVLFEPNAAEINKYSYPSIVERLEKLFGNN